MRFILPSPYRSQSVVKRVLASIGALIGLCALAIFGVLALAILIVGGAAWFCWFRWRLHRLRKQMGTSPNGTSGRDSDDFIEGEYVVVNERHESVR